MLSTGTVSSITRPIVFAGLGVLFSVQAGWSCACSEIKIPEGKDFSVTEGLSYMKSDQYKKEFDQAISDAKAACEKHKGEKHLAIVSDIDETVLDNSPYFDEHKNGSWVGWDKWISAEKAPSLKPTADFLAWARQQGFAIFFITGRSESERRDTIDNLVKAGIVYDGLYMRPDGDDSRAELMKTKFRKKIEDMGFKTIVSIGDQFSDLAGGYAEDCEKLPNKIYFIK